MTTEIERVDRNEDFEFIGFRLSWGAIVAGFVVAMVVQIILSLLGLAIGLGTINFQGQQPLEGIGIGAGIWAVATALISLFMGGLAAGHLAGILTRFDGVMHGVLVWGLTTIVTLWAVTTGLGTVLGGAFGVAGQTISAAVGGVSQVGAAVVGQAGQQGMPQVGEDVNREEMVAILQQRTGLTRQQAEQTVDEIMQTQRQFQLQAEQIQQQAPEVATEVAGAISTAAWWALLAAILSLAAAAGGAALTAEE